MKPEMGIQSGRGGDFAPLSGSPGLPDDLIDQSAQVGTLVQHPAMRKNSTSWSEFVPEIADAKVIHSRKNVCNPLNLLIEKVLRIFCDETLDT